MQERPVLFSKYPAGFDMGPLNPLEMIAEFRHGCSNAGARGSLEEQRRRIPEECDECFNGLLGVMLKHENLPGDCRTEVAAYPKEATAEERRAFLDLLRRRLRGDG